jgi:homoserine O-succinyltransferase
MIISKKYFPKSFDLGFFMFFFKNKKTKTKILFNLKKMTLISTKNSPLWLKDIGMNQEDANKQDIRPLNIGILNLMPDSALLKTEEQFLRPLHNASGAIQIISHFFRAKSIKRSHEINNITKYYKDFTTEELIKCDMVIITGANVLSQKDEKGNTLLLCETETGKEVLEFYELAEKAGVTIIVTSCFSTQVIAQSKYKVNTQLVENEKDSLQKLIGVFSHEATKDGRKNYLTKNLNTQLNIIHARYDKLNVKELKKNKELRILIETTEEEREEAHLIIDPKKLWFGFQGHSEYSTESLFKEWRRYAVLHFKNPEKNKFPGKISNYLTNKGYKILENYKKEILKAVKNKEKKMPEIRTKDVLPYIINNWTDTNNTIWARILNAVYQLTGKKSGERLTKKRGINEKEFPLDSL